MWRKILSCALTFSALLLLIALPFSATTEHGGHGGTFPETSAHGGSGGHFDAPLETASDSDVASVVNYMGLVRSTDLWTFVLLGFSIAFEFWIVYYIVNKA